MSDLFASFGAFIVAVFAHLITLLAGCVVTVVIGIIEKRILKRPISLRLEIGILSGFILFACFQAWRDEHEARKQSEAKLVQIVPEITAAIDMSADTSEMGGRAFVLAVLHVANPNGPPTSLTDWQMEVSSPFIGFRQLTTPLLPPGGVVFDSRADPRKKLEIHTQDNCVVSTQRPITTGEIRTCWLLGKYDGPYDDLDTHTFQQTVRFTDVRTGRHHLISADLHAGHDDLLQHMP